MALNFENPLGSNLKVKKEKECSKAFIYMGTETKTPCAITSIQIKFNFMAARKFKGVEMTHGLTKQAQANSHTMAKPILEGNLTIPITLPTLS